MIDNRPLWKKPWVVMLMVLLAGSLGAWLALDRPLPEGWLDSSGRPQLEVPELFQPDPPRRIFCAESVDNGTCSCITSSGQRPEIDQQECQRRARASDTRTHQSGAD